MTDILFFSDDSLGHLLPTFPIAKNLTDHGYKVTYIGQEKVLKMANEMGFDTYDLLTTLPENKGLSGILSGAFDNMLEESKPQLIIATAHSTLEILALYFRYRIKTILVWSHFPVGLRFDSLRQNPYFERAKGFALERMKQVDPEELFEMIELFQKEGFEITRLEDLVELCGDFSHFITCTQDLYFGRIANRANEIYLGYKHLPPRLSSVCNSDNVLNLAKQMRANGRKIIFCSLGTASGELFTKKAKQFFEFIISCMSSNELKNYFMIIAAGPLQKELNKLNLPDNVKIEEWVPQSEMLSVAQTAIIHGGMGSIKECVFNHVPMLINPMGRDQFENAKMVTKHQLGQEIDTEQLSKSDFIQKIQLLENPGYHDSLVKMQESFLNEYNKKKEVAFVKQWIGEPEFSANLI